MGGGPAGVSPSIIAAISNSRPLLIPPILNRPHPFILNSVEG